MPLDDKFALFVFVLLRIAKFAVSQLEQFIYDCAIEAVRRPK